MLQPNDIVPRQFYHSPKHQLEPGFRQQLAIHSLLQATKKKKLKALYTRYILHVKRPRLHFYQYVIMFPIFQCAS